LHPFFDIIFLLQNFAIVSWEGCSFVSVVVGMACKPFDGLSPYFLIGSDSKRINGMPILSDDSEALNCDTAETIEDARKIFCVNNNLVGMAGYFNSGFIEVFINYLKQNDKGNIKELLKLALSFQKSYAISDDSFGVFRCRTIIGRCNQGKPIISNMTVDIRNLSVAGYDCAEPGYGSYFVTCIGKSGLEDLEIELQKEVNGTNLNIKAVKYAIEKYIKKAAIRYPETINDKVVFDRCL
jgi:hypothetical protein